MTRTPGKSPFHWQNIAAWVLIAALVGYGLYAQYQEQHANDTPSAPATQVAESESKATPATAPDDDSDKSASTAESKSSAKPETKNEATPAPSETKPTKNSDSIGFSKPTTSGETSKSPPSKSPPAKSPQEKSPVAKSSPVEKSASTKSTPPTDTANPKNSSPGKEVASGKTKPTDTRTPPGSSNPRRGVFQNVTIRDQDGDVIYKGEVDLTKSLERIAKDQVISRFPHDGTVFQNREGRLPRQSPGYYREWVHPTPGEGGPGPQRIVTGEDGDIWYTHDHYKTFRRVPP